MQRRQTKKIRIKKIQGSQALWSPDLLAIEEPMEIRLHFSPSPNLSEIKLVVTMRTPGDDFDLCAGFLWAEGIITKRKQLLRLSYCLENVPDEQLYNIVNVELSSELESHCRSFGRNFFMNSSCGVCGKASIESLETRCEVLPEGDLKLESSQIHSLPEKLRLSQATFEETGGLHAAGLFSSDCSLIALREDVGRHNALDKLIGSQILNEKNCLLNKVLVVSGRASFELVQKALMARISIMIAVGAPSSLAVELAQKYNMTLLGFTRKQRFNIYSGAQRVKGITTT